MARFWPQIESRSIQGWTEGFQTLYSKPDASRQPEEFWSAVMAHVSTVGEAIRRTNYRDLVQSAAHAFCWMCCYVGKCSNGSDHLFKISDNLYDIVELK